MISDDLIGLVIDLHLTQDQSVRMSPRTHRVADGLGGRMVKGVSQRLAVDRHHIRRSLPSLQHRRAPRRSQYPKCPARDVEHWHIGDRSRWQSARGLGRQGCALWPCLLSLAVSQGIAPLHIAEEEL